MGHHDGRVRLPPSSIRFTQDSISNRFLNMTKMIGETLDDLCTGTCRVTDMPPIRVFKYSSRWWSLDNRRLWVFREYERLGGCSNVPVKEVSFAERYRHKFTTNNNGLTVRVRGVNTGGIWHSQPDGALLKLSERESKKAKSAHQNAKGYYKKSVSFNSVSSERRQSTGRCGTPFRESFYKARQMPLTTTRTMPSTVFPHESAKYTIDTTSPMCINCHMAVKVQQQCEKKGELVGMHKMEKTERPDSPYYPQVTKRRNEQRESEILAHERVLHEIHSLDQTTQNPVPPGLPQGTDSTGKTKETAPTNARRLAPSANSTREHRLVNHDEASITEAILDFFMSCFRARQGHSNS